MSEARPPGPWAIAVALVGVAGCAPARPAPPAPVPAPELPAEPKARPEIERPVLRPPPAPERDDLIDSPMGEHPAFRAEVEAWVRFWRTRGAAWFPDYLRRMVPLVPAVDSILAERGLPPSLRYLPIVESGYSPRAVSRARAVGLWQFTGATARDFGMRVSPLLDERRDPLRSTEAAAEYLARLRDRFGSWFLALAAYNAGPGRIERILERHAPPAPPSDSVYWAVRERLPRETRDFVPKLFAAARIAADPLAHGFDPPPPGPALTFDDVVVPDATTLDVVARAAGATIEEIEALNPHVVRGLTPPGRETALRVPVGRGGIFRVNYARIPPRERVTFVEHRVRFGETLSHIARRYRIRVDDLLAANPGVRPRALQIHQLLTVPVAPRARASGTGGA